MTIGSKFSENQEINQKNGNKLRSKGYSDKSLNEFIPNNDSIMKIRNQMRKVYNDCKKCGDPLSNNALKIKGICMMCENG